MQIYYQLVSLAAVIEMCCGSNYTFLRKDQKIVMTPSLNGSFNLHKQVQISCHLQESTLKYMAIHNSSKFYIGLRYERHKIDSRNIATIRSAVHPFFSINKTSFYKLKPTNWTIATTSNSSGDFNFNLETVQIGYGRIAVKLIEVTSENITQLISSQLYLISCVRQVRLVDTGFNIAVCTLAILNTFALGCVADLDTLKAAAKHRLQVVIAVIAQYIAMPLLTFGLLKVLQVQNELAVGFLCLTSVPGGGLGYLTVSVTGNTNRQYSILINALQLTLSIVAVPVYVYSLGQLFPNEAGKVVTPLYYLVFWPIGLLLPFVVGMIVKRKKEEISNGFLNWLIKPCLLLAFILFITLGLYINMYVFSVLDNAALVTGGVIPFMGFGIGGIMMLLAKQGKTAAKTLAIESTIMNSVVVIVALRFTLPPPDADLASAAAMWVLFLTPAPFVLMFLFHRIKKKIMFHFKKKELENEQKTTLMNSFAAITHNAIQLGGIEQRVPEPNSPSPSSQMNYENGADSRLLISDFESLNDHSHTNVNNIGFTLNTPVEDGGFHVAQPQECIEKPVQIC